MAIAYCEHPLTKEEKNNIRREGFKIVDILFKPEKLADGDKIVTKPATKKAK